MTYPRFRTASSAALGAAVSGAVLLVTGGPALASTAAATTSTAATTTSPATSTCCTTSVNGPAVTMKITTPGRSARATFRGSVGQRVAEVLTNPVTSDAGCVQITLLDPSGAVVNSGSSCGNGNPAGIGPVDLTVPGVYTVKLTLDTAATGSGKLWVSAPVGVGGTTVNGPSTAMDITRVGQGVQRTFAGKAGQRVAEAVTNPVTSDAGCVSLTLFDPSGAPVNSGSSCGNGNPVGIDPVALPATGTYTVRLEADTVATGSGTLWVSAPVTVGTVTVNGPSAAMNITRVGQGVQRTFHGTSGQLISGTIGNPVTSDGGCGTLTLLAPGGGPVTDGSGCGDGNPISFGPVRLSATGTYTVRFEVDTTATGQGRVTVSAG